jgi:glutamate-ammonia-ligase adenylyltransferase
MKVAGVGDFSYEYDANDRLVRVIDPRDNVTSFEYDALGREIRRVRERLARESPAQAPGFVDLKTEPGGILDVELIVQYLQLVHGAEHAEVRARATMRALDDLRAVGAFDRPTHEALRSAYLLLRRLENRLRIVDDTATNRFHAEPSHDLDRLARRMGYRGGEEMVGAALLKDHLAATTAVRRAFEQVFGRLLASTADRG